MVSLGASYIVYIPLNEYCVRLMFEFMNVFLFMEVSLAQFKCYTF